MKICKKYDKNINDMLKLYNFACQECEKEKECYKLISKEK